MFNIADLAEAEWVIELMGEGFEFPQPTTVIYQDCARCKSRQFLTATAYSFKYVLSYDNTLEKWERWEVCCAECGLKQKITIITEIPPDEHHPRRDLLKAAMFDE